MNKQMIDFLIRAKRATYAGKGAETVPSREKSHDLIYEDGDYMYYDTYLGGNKFAGEEALWIKKNPYWSMNYVKGNRGKLQRKLFEGSIAIGSGGKAI